jgi:hypothetical protein
MDPKEALSRQHSAVSESQQQHQKRFTAEDVEKSKITAAQRAEALLRRIGETCDELERLAEENPGLMGGVMQGAEEHKDAYLRLKARLQVADAAPRCRWVRQDGTSCGSPQMKKHIYCFAHRQMMEARALALSLPAPEDANAIQIGIMRIQKALIEGTISTKSAGLLLYSMQLAQQNVGQVTFGQAKTVELVTETVSEMEAFSQNQHQTLFTTEGTEDTEKEKGQRSFTAEDAKDAERNKTLPLMNADEEALSDQHSAFSKNQYRGPAGERKGPTSEPRPEPFEFRLPLEMYRMDTREGRKAYEEEVRRRNRTSGDGGIGTPPKMAAANEHPGARADLG